MLKISRTEAVNLNKSFSLFRKQTIKRQNIQTNIFVGKFNEYERKYKKAGLAENFADMIFVFAENLAKAGIDDLAGIIYSNLMKLPIQNPQTKEKYALQALDFYNKKGDSIHALSRIIDLKKMYMHTKQKRKYAKMLFSEEKELENICSDFRRAKQQYSTYRREQKPLEKYELQLARTKIDVAKLIKKETPQKARATLYKAKNIFAKYNKKSDVDFINKMLSEIEII